MMESAEVQLTACRRQVRRVRAGSEKEDAQKVLDRSLDIYRQTVLLYHRTLKKPWNYIPGFLMGYREVKGKKTVPWICKKIKKAGIYMTIGFLIFGILLALFILWGMSTQRRLAALDENRLLCMNKQPDKTVFEGAQLTSFTIREDSNLLLGGHPRG